MKPHHIAFIKMGTFSYVNASLLQAFQATFPHYEIDVIDVYRDLFSRSKHSRSPIHLSDVLKDTLTQKALLFAPFAILKEYLPDVLWGKIDRRLLCKKSGLKQLLVYTPYFFRAVKTALAQRLCQKHYTFSFQTQSLFDASFAGLPHFVYTDHTLQANLRYTSFERRKPFSKAWIALEHTIYQHAALNFTTSNFVTQSIVEDYGIDAQKVVCVYSGMNVESDFTPGHKNYEAKHILFIGIGWENKGGPDLLEAFTRVLHVHPDAHLTIIGSQPEVDIPHCDVVGRLPKEQLHHYFQQATVFCLPSRLDASAVVLIEAAAYGLPVVATDVGGASERMVDGTTGYLVPPGNVDALTDALLELVGKPHKCREFGEQGYHFTMERFRWNIVSANIKTHIASVLNI